MTLLGVQAQAAGRNVVISGDSGGSVVGYAMQAARFQSSGTRVVVAGRCDSACTLYLSLPRSNICVGSGAYFRFHAPTAEAGQDTAKRFMLRKYPGWVRGWIAANGGLTSRLITMNAAYARRHLPSCAESVASAEHRLLE